MTYRNMVLIDGKAVDIRELPEEERKRLADYWNRRAAERLGYKETEKTA